MFNILKKLFGGSSRRDKRRDTKKDFEYAPDLGSLERNLHVKDAPFQQEEQFPRFLEKAKRKKRNWFRRKKKKGQEYDTASSTYDDPEYLAYRARQEHLYQDAKKQGKFSGDKPIKIMRTWQARLIRFTLYWGGIATAWAFLTLIGMVALYAYLAPDPFQAGLSKNPANIIIMAENGKVIAEKGLRRNHVPLNKMPKHVVNAVLGTEDSRFYYHFGFDPIGMTRAMIANRQAGRVIQGGSTVTQQLAKVLFLEPKRTYWRKAEEMLLALWLEYRLSKDEILELYLNRIYFGSGNYGIEAAAQHYFGKSIENVTLYEAAILAGLIKSPSYYAPTRDMDRALVRGKVVLNSMRDAWFISKVEYEQALQNIPTLRTYLPSESYGYIIDWVMELVAAYGQDLQEDMIVQTTIDYDLQGAAQRIVKENMDQQAGALDAGQGAAVIMSTKGEVKALVGGRDYAKNQFNRIVKARRQPGSTFKPFIFLAAMEKGMTPDNEVYDGPITIGNWSPENHNNKYYGEVTLRQALSYSLNTVSVRLSEWVGREKVIQTAHRLGISTDLKNNPSIALGSSEISPLEITAAYAPFANGGYAVKPHVIKKITSQNGQVLFSDQTEHLGRVMRPQHVAAMNDMLTATIAVGTGQKAALEPHQAAGKTGTGQDYRDAWFVGYTAHYVTGVWLGNDDYKPMKRVTGGSLPTIIWKDLMTYAHTNKQVASLPGGQWAHSQGQSLAQNEGVFGGGGGQRRGFWDSLFGGGSGPESASVSDTTLGSPPPSGSSGPRRGKKSNFDNVFETN